MSHYWNWYGFSLSHGFLTNVDGLQSIHRAWQRSGGRVSERNDNLRRHLLSHIAAKVGHQQELTRKLVPALPPFAKRVVADNGWFDVLLRLNVELVPDAIARITPTGSAPATARRTDARCLAPAWQRRLD